MRGNGSPERERTESKISERDRYDMPARAALPATEPQLRVLVAIEQHLESRGYPPTVRDLCDALGVSSTNGMVSHLEALARKGYIEREAGVSRGIRVLVASKNAGPTMQARPIAKAHLCSSCAKCGRRTA